MVRFFKIYGILITYLITFLHHNPGVDHICLVPGLLYSFLLNWSLLLHSFPSKVFHPHRPFHFKLVCVTPLLKPTCHWEEPVVFDGIQGPVLTMPPHPPPLSTHKHASQGLYHATLSHFIPSNTLAFLLALNMPAASLPQILFGSHHFRGISPDQHMNHLLPPPASWSMYSCGSRLIHKHTNI